jgi:hypothetical protein
MTTPLGGEERPESGRTEEQWFEDTTSRSS